MIVSDRSELTFSGPFDRVLGYSSRIAMPLSLVLGGLGWVRRVSRGGSSLRRSSDSDALGLLRMAAEEHHGRWYRSHCITAIRPLVDPQALYVGPERRRAERRRRDRRRPREGIGSWSPASADPRRPSVVLTQGERRSGERRRRQDRRQLPLDSN
jgi:hypothetical protein